ncbi:MAG: hypothetical protein ACKO6N_23105 [Myxococcota bacterium]
MVTYLRRLVLWSMVAGVMAGVMAGGLSACQSEAEVEPTPIIPADAVTYEQVAPILARSCESCHQMGGVAPFSLVGYENASRFAAASKASVLSGNMPPLKVTHDGSCQTFTDKRFLTAEEKQLLADWADSGALRRDPTYQPPSTSRPPELSDESVTFEMPSSYSPKSSSGHPQDDYRCFFMEPALDRDQYLTGYEVLPGDRSMVHHVILMSLLEEDEATAAELDAQDDRPGWDCVTGAGEGIPFYNVVMAWAPGSDVERFPAGTGIKLRQGQRLVMQVHYNLTSTQGTDNTRLRLELTDSVDKQLRGLLPGPSEFELPPGQPEYTIDYRIPLSKIQHRFQFMEGISFDSMTVYAAGSHMHLLGQEQRASVVPAGAAESSEKSCLIETKNFDFNWQLFFFYKEPVKVSMKDDLLLSCTYDTTSKDVPTYYGEGTEDEMCVTLLYVTFDE